MKILLLIILLLLWIIYQNYEFFVASNADDALECSLNSPDCIQNLQIKDPFTDLINAFIKKYEKIPEISFEIIKTENSYIFPHVKKFKNIIESYLNNNQYTIVADLTNIQSNNNQYRFSTSINDKINFLNIFVIVTIIDDKLAGFEILKFEKNQDELYYSFNQQTSTFKLKNKYGLFDKSAKDIQITSDQIYKFNNVLKNKYSKLNFQNTL